MKLESCVKTEIIDFRNQLKEIIVQKLAIYIFAIVSFRIVVYS